MGETDLLTQTPRYTLEAGESVIASLERSFYGVGEQIFSYIPLFILAILVFLIGWAVILLVRYLTDRFLKILGVNKLATKLKIHDALARANIQSSLSQIIAKIVYYLAFVAVFRMAVDVLKLEEVTRAIDDVLEYIVTNVFPASIIFIVGLYAAHAVRKIVLNIGGKTKVRYYQVLSNLAYVSIIVSTSIPALEKLGVDPSIFQDNITILIAGVALAIGLGGKKTAEKIIDEIYEKMRK